MNWKASRTMTSSVSIYDWFGNIDIEVSYKVKLKNEKGGLI